MKGAVAAGHPLTAAAGARVLDGGRQRRRRLRGRRVRRLGGGEPADRARGRRLRARRPVGRTAAAGGGLLRLDPRASAARRPPRRRCTRSTSPSAVTARRRRSSGSGRRRAPCPARRRASRPFIAPTAGCPGAILLEPAIELARSGVEVSRPQAHLHAILDLILRHTDEGRRVYSRPGRITARARRRRCSCPISAGRSSRSPSRARQRSIGGELARAIVRDRA